MAVLPSVRLGDTLTSAVQAPHQSQRFAAVPSTRAPRKGDVHGAPRIPVRSRRRRRMG